MYQKFIYTEMKLNTMEKVYSEIINRDQRIRVRPSEKVGHATSRGRTIEHMPVPGADIGVTTPGTDCHQAQGAGSDGY